MLGFVTIPDAGGADRLLAETAALLEREGLRLAGAGRSARYASRPQAL